MRTRSYYNLTPSGEEFLKSNDLFFKNRPLFDLFTDVKDGRPVTDDSRVEWLRRQGYIEYEDLDGMDLPQLLTSLTKRDKDMGEILSTYKRLATQENPPDRDVRRAIKLMLDNDELFDDEGGRLDKYRREQRKALKQSKSPSDRRILLDSIIAGDIHDSHSDYLARLPEARRILDKLAEE